MTSPLERLKKIKQQADSSIEHRANFNRFAAILQEEERREYTAQIKVLMGTDDAAALALFPDGLYETAEQARESAREFWREIRKEYP